MKQEDKNIIIKYRLDRIDSMILEIRQLIDSGFYETAINRTYYGMLYAVMCLALLHNFISSKDKQLLKWLRKEYVLSDKLDKIVFKVYFNSYKDRLDADYYFRTFEKEYVIDSYSKMKDFVSVIKNEINKELL
jgi:uncharacterized protein (UPF0332 family)